MAAPRRPPRPLQRSSHYMSTPILAPVPGPPGLPQGGVADPVSRWVEQATRITKSASYSEVGGSCGSSSSTESVSSLSTAASTPPSLLSEEEVCVVASAYSSYRTQSHVSPTLVNLYTATGGEPWSLAYTGVPALLLSLGGSKARQGRQVTIVVAERGTGFALWRDTLDYLSCYRAEDTQFHTLHSAGDHRIRVGLSWDQEELATAFLAQVERLTSRPDNVGLSGPRKQREGRGRSGGGRPVARVDKRQISSPCGFRHPVAVRQEDFSSYFSLQLLLPHREAEGVEEECRQ